MKWNPVKGPDTYLLILDMGCDSGSCQKSI